MIYVPITDTTKQNARVSTGKLHIYNPEIDSFAQFNNTVILIVELIIVVYIYV